MDNERFKRLESIAIHAPPAPESFELSPDEIEPLPDSLASFIYCRDRHPDLPDDEVVQKALSKWRARYEDGLYIDYFLPGTASEEQAKLVAVFWKEYTDREEEYQLEIDQREKERSTVSARNAARRQARWSIVYAWMLIEELSVHDVVLKGYFPD
ncbi:hypothetical protein [Kushneria indalinina]|uniref:Uncharacterized protein n=1 Tax=Kushneria indalinina DSM 14324 TaxID=1122140 RepID=A0A3D9E0T8_9GAMM|nr:hypothetical protein [Kushneria indalinina]REC96672.1 hypothetical protein C8D72_0004 [Kushneria indalinina DSM 14324]